MSELANNKRMAKNTMYMYIRMAVTMIVELYTSRVVLETLGVENYGIYNVVASFIVAFTFISGPLGTATQRFLTFELGKGRKDLLNVVFNLSIYTYLILAVVLVFVIEFVGGWFIENKMVLPSERIDAAFYAFHFSVVALIFTLMKTPFESLMIAYEKLNFYAYVSIVEGLLKLANAFCLSFLSLDKLKLFSLNLCIISILIFLSFAVYCLKTFSDVRIQSLKSVWNGKKFKELMGFSGWSLFGSIASMSANQGLNILLNTFFGVVVNAAMGFSNQIAAAMNRFSGSFQIAFRPQIVKYYASKNMDSLRSLISNTSKYSYLLLFALVCPICFNIRVVLKMWLVNPPEFASEFAVFMLVYTLLESLSAPMWMAIQATGKIKKYQIAISVAMFLNLGISYVFLKNGFSPQIVFIVKCFLDILYLMVRLYFVRSLIGFSCFKYLKNTIFPVLSVSVIMILAMLIIKSYLCLENDLVESLLLVVFFLLIYVPVSLFVGLSKQNRQLLFDFLNKKIGRR